MEDIVTVTPPQGYEALTQHFLSQPEVNMDGKGFGSDALKVKGKIFAMLVKNRLVVKLPRNRVDELIAQGSGERFDPRRDGRLMKEWLVIDSSFEKDWQTLATEAMKFVKGTSNP